MYHTWYTMSLHQNLHLYHIILYHTKMTSKINSAIHRFYLSQCICRSPRVTETLSHVCATVAESKASLFACSTNIAEGNTLRTLVLLRASATTFLCLDDTGYLLECYTRCQHYKAWKAFCSIKNCFVCPSYEFPLVPDLLVIINCSI